MMRKFFRFAKSNFASLSETTENTALSFRSILRTTNYSLQTRSGFSLIELLTAIGVMAVIFTLAFIVSSRFYRRATVDTERDTVVSLLVRARSDALNNVDQAGHGFYRATSTYIVFEGNSYA